MLKPVKRSATDAARISRTLSYWLRHRPDAGGLRLDGQGWAEVAAVLAALEAKGNGVSHERLAELVASNDKRRFEMSPDGHRIRARQGHSVAVEGDWVEAQPPELLYHGTVEAALASIRCEGLRPMRRHHVHLSPDPDTAARVGARRGPPVVLTIRAAALAVAGARFFVTGNGVWLVDAVPPPFIDRPGPEEGPPGHLRGGRS